MRKLLPVLFALALLAVGVALYLARPRPRAWTSDSAAALEEFEKGLTAQTRVYISDAIAHYERALELDPSFVAPRIHLLRFYRVDEKRQQLLTELAAADLDKLTAREAFLVEFNLATGADRQAEAERLLADYLAKHPDDPWALDVRCNREQEPAEQEACLQRLIDIEPNWVMAQNLLGYLAMAGGRFDEAEERFRNYQYIAPDQPNPHDSMGELLLILGKHREAEAEFRQALALRPDFDASWGNLVRIAAIEGQTAAAERLVDEAKAAGVNTQSLDRVDCERRFLELAASRLWEEIWHLSESCYQPARSTFFVLPRHQAALETGRLAAAAEIEAAVANITSKDRGRFFGGSDQQGAIHQVVMGQRLASEGDLPGAITAFESADDLVNTTNWIDASLELRIRLGLVHLLRRAGRDADADAVFARVRALNPVFADLLELFAPPMDSRPPLR